MTNPKRLLFPTRDARRKKVHRTVWREGFDSGARQFSRYLLTIPRSSWRMMVELAAKTPYKRRVKRPRGGEVTRLLTRRCHALKVRG